MSPNDLERFLGLLTGLQEYYSKTLSEPIIQVYWNSLLPYDIEEVDRAITRHTRNPETGQFMPKVADLVKLIEGSTSDRAALAWSKVHRAIRHIGPYQSVAFDDPIIHLVISDMGGYVPLCDVETEKMPFKAREFENRYRGYAMRDSLQEAPQKMIGIVEQHNSAHGFIQNIPETKSLGQLSQKALSRSGTIGIDERKRGMK